MPAVSGLIKFICARDESLTLSVWKLPFLLWSFTHDTLKVIMHLSFMFYWWSALAVALEWGPLQHLVALWALNTAVSIASVIALTSHLESYRSESIAENVAILSACCGAWTEGLLKSLCRTFLLVILSGIFSISAFVVLSLRVCCLPVSLLRLCLSLEYNTNHFLDMPCCYPWAKPHDFSYDSIYLEWWYLNCSVCYLSSWGPVVQACILRLNYWT